MGYFEPILGVRVIDLGHFGPISRVLGLDSDPFQPNIEAYPGGYFNGLEVVGLHFGLVQRLSELLHWAILGVLPLDSDPFQPIA